MKDPILAMTGDNIVTLSIDMQVQLERGTGTRPVLWLLAQARERARQALTDLANVVPTDTVAIVLLQTRVELYANMVEDCRALLDRAKEADAKIEEDIRVEIADVLDVEEARELGLRPTPEDL